MNLAGCANCLLHGWKQVEDLDSLQRCTRCKLIQYCGRECQAEHWKRIHKKQCRYFADPVKAQKWGHNEEDCSICLQAAQVGKDELRRPTNPNYECIMKEMFPPHMYHSHPFPVTGQPGVTSEKLVIVLWQLLKKFELTQPGIISSCQGKLLKVYIELKMIRLQIWKDRKISPQSERRVMNISPKSLGDLLSTIVEKVGNDESVKNLFQIILLVKGMSSDVFLSELVQVLIDPLADIPSDLRTIMSQAMSNNAKFLTIANQILNALTNQVIPYKDLVRMACEGNLVKRCNFCSENTTIASMGRRCGGGPEGGGFFSCQLMGIYGCGAPDCRRKADAMIQEDFQFGAAVIATAGERAATRCDFCKKLPPSEGGHRCKKCLSVIYCSTECQDQDWKIHKEFCREDVEERKKKYGSSGRRKEARDNVKQLEKGLEEMDFQELETENVQLFQEGVEVVRKFRLKRASKKAKK